ncbi:TIGR03086 family metal-binding protein [Streptomyces sp. QH1-20]|uniref:TIGR03086 family metal-binding protein n=1 Tax=Streptomyces sp. QH1-20 TaxID=3240934 RepID=UPI003510F72F
MTVMCDLGPAARRMADLVDGVPDSLLTAPTPCERYTLGDLIEHVNGLSLAFTAAATKDATEAGARATSQGPSGHAARLDDDWRTRIPARLAALADAWRAPDAWAGATRAGGLNLPADLAGRIALNELVVHGWDVARAMGRPYEADARELEACLSFVSAMSGPDQQDSRGDAFGPVVDVPADAPLLDRVIGLSGRDPAWRRPEP